MKSIIPKIRLTDKLLSDYGAIKRTGEDLVRSKFCVDADLQKNETNTESKLKTLFSIEIKNNGNESKVVELLNWKWIWQTDESKLMQYENYKTIKTCSNTNVSYIDLLRELFTDKFLIYEIVLKKSSSFREEKPSIHWQNWFLGKLVFEKILYFLYSPTQQTDNFMTCFDSFVLDKGASMKIEIPANEVYCFDFKVSCEYNNIN